MCQSAPRTEAAVNREQTSPTVWVHRGARCSSVCTPASSRSLSAGLHLCLRCTRAGCVPPEPAARSGPAQLSLAMLLSAVQTRSEPCTGIFKPPLLPEQNCTLPLPDAPVGAVFLCLQPVHPSGSRQLPCCK